MLQNRYTANSPQCYYSLSFVYFYQHKLHIQLVLLFLSIISLFHPKMKGLVLQMLLQMEQSLGLQEMCKIILLPLKLELYPPFIHSIPILLRTQVFTMEVSSCG